MAERLTVEEDLKERSETVAAMRDLVSKVSELIVMSENRVDKANELICKAFSMIDKVTLEYTKQIEKLQVCRDELAEQNTNLITVVKGFQKEAEAYNKRYDILLDRLITLANRGMSENNINVK